MMDEKINPLEDRIVLRRIEPEDDPDMVIIIPDTAKQKPLQAEVVAVGPGVMDNNDVRMPMEVAVGDHVLIGKYTGTEVKIDGQERIIMREDDVLAVIR